MHVLVCASMYEIRGRNSIKGGKNVKPGKIRNLQSHNGSRKLRKFSRSRMMKQTAPLDLSRKI